MSERVRREGGREDVEKAREREERKRKRGRENKRGEGGMREA